MPMLLMQLMVRGLDGDNVAGPPATTFATLPVDSNKHADAVLLQADAMSIATTATRVETMLRTPLMASVLI